MNPALTLSLSINCTLSQDDRHLTRMLPLGGVQK
jgi:hypothetical protein